MDPRTVRRPRAALDFWAAVHVVIAIVLLRLVPIGAITSSPIPAARYVAVFGLALPMFVYAFLSGGWVARAAIGMLPR